MSNLPVHLQDGYRQFQESHFDPNREHYRRLATDGQSPEVMLVSCCDSRCDPETIFSAPPGDLFVVRNVANLIPPYETSGTYHGVSAALEFAVLNLRVKHILVMGHSACGGVMAAVDGNAAQQTEARFISNWMSMLDGARTEVLATHNGASRADLMTAMERAAVKLSLANLRSFPFVAEQEAAGHLRLHGSHFDIATGVLSVLDETTGAFMPL